MNHDHQTNHESKNDLNQSIQELDHDVKILDHDIKVANKGNRFWPTFGRGVFGSLGALVGATIIISLLLYLLQRLAVLPVIGEIFKLALAELRHGKPAP